MIYILKLIPHPSWSKPSNDPFFDGSHLAAINNDTEGLRILRLSERIGSGVSHRTMKSIGYSINKSIRDTCVKYRI